MQILLGVSASYQGVEHQRVEGVTVGVLHHDVEEGVQGVLQELVGKKKAEVLFMCAFTAVIIPSYRRL